MPKLIKLILFLFFCICLVSQEFSNDYEKHVYKTWLKNKNINEKKIHFVYNNFLAQDTLNKLRANVFNNKIELLQKHAEYDQSNPYFDHIYYIINRGLLLLEANLYKDFFDLLAQHQVILLDSVFFMAQVKQSKNSFVISELKIKTVEYYQVTVKFSSRHSDFVFNIAKFTNKVVNRYSIFLYEKMLISRLQKNENNLVLTLNNLTVLPAFSFVAELKLLENNSDSLEQISLNNSELKLRKEERVILKKLRTKNIEISKAFNFIDSLYVYEAFKERQSLFKFNKNEVVPFFNTLAEYKFLYSYYYVDNGKNTLELIFKNIPYLLYDKVYLQELRKGVYKANLFSFIKEDNLSEVSRKKNN